MFAYCNNNPVRFEDTQGNITQDALDLNEHDDDILDPDASGGSYSYANAYNPVDAGYRYGVDLSQAVNSSLFGGGLLVNGYISFASHTNPNSSSSNASLTNNPLSSTAYTNKVVEQMQCTDFHGFSIIVDNYRSVGALTQKLGKDQRLYTHLSIAGSYLGHDGYFVYIWDEDGVCNHRCFET